MCERKRSGCGKASVGKDVVDGHALPSGVELRPRGHAVDVSCHPGSWERVELRPAPRFDRTRSDLQRESPICGIDPRRGSGRKHREVFGDELPQQRPRRRAGPCRKIHVSPLRLRARYRRNQPVTGCPAPRARSSLVALRSARPQRPDGRIQEAGWRRRRARARAAEVTRDATASLRGNTHHRVEQMFEHGGWVVAQAGVHGRGLDDRAARRDQPVEALALGSCPIGPAASPPAQISGIVARCARIVARSTAGSSASTRCSSSSMRASRKSRAGHDTITPTLTNSSRSTRGHDADDRVVIRAAGRARIASSRKARGAARAALSRYSAYALRCWRRLRKRESPTSQRRE